MPATLDLGLQELLLRFKEAADLSQLRLHSQYMFSRLGSTASLPLQLTVHSGVRLNIGCRLAVGPKDWLENCFTRRRRDFRANVIVSAHDTDLAESVIAGLGFNPDQLQLPLSLTNKPASSGMAFHFPRVDATLKRLTSKYEDEANG